MDFINKDIYTKKNKVELFDLTTTLGLKIPKIILDYLEKAYSKKDIINMLSYTVGYNIIDTNLYSYIIEYINEYTLEDTTSEILNISTDSDNTENSDNSENSENLDDLNNNILFNDITSVNFIDLSNIFASNINNLDFNVDFIESNIPTYFNQSDDIEILNENKSNNSDESELFNELNKLDQLVESILDEPKPDIPNEPLFNILLDT